MTALGKEVGPQGPEVPFSESPSVVRTVAQLEMEGWKLSVLLRTEEVQQRVLPVTWDNPGGRMGTAGGYLAR